MKLHDDYYEEEHGGGSKIPYIYVVLIMSIVILGITALVFWVNQSNSRSDGSGYAAALAQKEASQSSSTTSESTTSDTKLTSDQLDIWTLPDTGRTRSSSLDSKYNGTVTNQTTGETLTSDSSDTSDTDKASTAEEIANGKTSVYDVSSKESMTSETESTEEEDEGEYETSMQVKLSDGTKVWVDLDEEMARNKYDFSSLTYQKPIMSYSEDGKVVSKCGVDISSNQGDVDFSKLKSAGVDFVMIKVGARGYSSGNIVLDENYADNIKAARKAGLDVGVYFCSQAVSKSEARDEADELLEAIQEYNINYPVAFVMETVTDDMARIEALDMDGRTQVAKTFMDRIANAGYTPMIYGDLEWLLTMVDMTALEDYDVWYAQDSNEPDYPYEFGMWQYDTDATVKGIDGNATMIISFNDYSK